VRVARRRGEEREEREEPRAAGDRARARHRFGKSVFQTRFAPGSGGRDVNARAVENANAQVVVMRGQNARARFRAALTLVARVE
jgi:hypothetical protein